MGERRMVRRTPSFCRHRLTSVALAAPVVLAVACAGGPRGNDTPQMNQAGKGNAGGLGAGAAGAGAGAGASGSGIGGSGAGGSGVGGSGVAGLGSGAGGGAAGVAGSAGASASGGRAASGGSGGAVGLGGALGMGGRGGATGGAGTSGGAGSGGAGGDTTMRPTVTAASGTTLIKVNPKVRHQTFEGFGTSLCWWANHVGGWSEAKRNALVDAIVDPTAGLGYNVFRYNIGGGDDPAHDHMDQFRDMPGFEPSAGTWTWDADANQRVILQRIVERGSGLVLEAFSNSPPYWMTKSGCASGNGDGSNNLLDASYDAFADYLTEVVKHYADTYGITFRTLEPLNEPNASWWTANGSQEGCHFSPSNQATIVKAVAAKLTAKGLTATTVSASDENSIDDAYNNLRGFDAATLAGITQMNTHSYGGTRRTDLRALATSKSKRLWQSESGPLNQTLANDTDAAVFMAGRIITDLRDLGAEAWVDWQVGDPSHNWASFVLDDGQQTFTYLKRFYMHAGFSRYIRPGATFVDVNSPDMVAAVSADGATLALVVRNGDTTASKGYTFDLTALATVGAAAEAHRTSKSEDLASLAALPIQGWSFVATVAPYSVTTFVIPMP
jgi:O-glycosyl hydrolase